MAKQIQVPATLEGVSTKKDGSLSLRFSTQELNVEDKTVILGYLNAFGWLLFKDTERDFKEEEIKELEAIRRDTGGKSPSQRLRAVLFLLWKNKTDGTSFEQYYSQQMEQIIENRKRGLD